MRKWIVTSGIGETFEWEAFEVCAQADGALVFRNGRLEEIARYEAGEWVSLAPAE